MAERDKDMRKFERVAAQRLTAANLLLEHGFRLEATCIAGYVAECALKALILKRTPKTEHAGMLEKLTKVGALGHDFEYLKGILTRPPLHCPLPRDINNRFRRVASWSTDLRYEVGLIEAKVAKDFLDAARQIHDWAKGS